VVAYTAGSLSAVCTAAKPKAIALLSAVPGSGTVPVASDVSPSKSKILNAPTGPPPIAGQPKVSDVNGSALGIANNIVKGIPFPCSGCKAINEVVKLTGSYNVTHVCCTITECLCVECVG